MSPLHDTDPLLSGWTRAPAWQEGLLRLVLGDRAFVLRRGEDMEALWDSLDADAFGEDEHMPYWAEIWPASLLLGAWLLSHRTAIAGRRCLELGCGMGLSAMAASAAGARVVAVDYEESAIAHAATNARANGTPLDLLVMDWRRPCLVPGSFDLIWGSDILYESRFYAPLVHIFRTLLAPGGRIWLSEPWRGISKPVWDRLREDGFTVRRLHEEPVPFSTYRSVVGLYEIQPSRKE